MTINEAIQLLITYKTKHGGETLVYFDCPDCKVAFTPTVLVAEGIHIKTEKK